MAKAERKVGFHDDHSESRNRLRHPQPQQPRCPQCGSSKLFKDGVRRLSSGKQVQRYLCRECGYRFSQSQLLNKKSSKGSTCRVSAALKPGRVINLAKVEPLKDRVAGATETAKDGKLTRQEVKGKLVEFTWFMQKEGFKPSTIEARLDCINNLVNRGFGSDLLNPEAIKGAIAKQETWGDGYKANVVLAYTTFLLMHGILWNPPRYERPQRLPFIPLESELDQLIMSTGRIVSVFLQALKETAADPGEMNALEWIDINTENRTVTINHPVKGHKPRIISVSRNLIERLNTLPKVSERVFQAGVRAFQSNYYKQRRVKARKFSNPRLMKITFTTFRHWKATMEYHKTKDILWVMKLLGHNSLKTTLVYIDLEKALFNEANDEFTVKVADTLDEACKLLEVGFEYVTDMEDKKLFRKRK